MALMSIIYTNMCLNMISWVLGSVSLAIATPPHLSFIGECLNAILSGFLNV